MNFIKNTIKNKNNENHLITLNLIQYMAEKWNNYLKKKKRSKSCTILNGQILNKF